MSKGWHNEYERHAMSAMGIKTGRKVYVRAQGTVRKINPLINAKINSELATNIRKAREDAEEKRVIASKEVSHASEWKKAEAKKYDVWDVEGDDLNPYEEAVAWSNIIKSGVWRSLQGWYGRRVNDFIQEGLISKEGKINKELLEEKFEGGY
jgi:hypothetical protein